MRGKLVENVKYQKIFEPVSITSSTVLYNGIAASTGGYIDTEDYDELNVVLNIGIAATGAVIDAAIYESDDVDASASTAITGADFTQITPTTDQTMEIISILCKNYKRYMWLRTSKTDVGGAAAVLSATAVLGKPDSGAVSQTVVADLE